LAIIILFVPCFGLKLWLVCFVFAFSLSFERLNQASLTVTQIYILSINVHLVLQATVVLAVLLIIHVHSSVSDT